jgi:hypothetical protein
VARAGSFGGSLTPFGGGGGAIGNYSIGGWLADLALYEIEVRWRNGEASDEEYLAALRRAVEARTPGTRDYIAAQDKLQDVEYRIERSKVEDDLDALIAFDQSWLARLNPDSLRYRQLQQSLAAELAQRRSRDYGRLVDQYNAGRLSTQALLDWVNNTLDGLPADAPDYDTWTGRRQELTQRLASERDAEVYQDYQMRRISGQAFLAYIRQRRDSFDPASPDWADWNRRLEDATQRVRQDELARQDTAFFNAYREGKVSDADYLRYLQRRIDEMDPDDPDRPVWEHRLRQAAFSIAEDQLRFDVERGKRPVADLIRFYENYRRGLNPNSAEWRQITRQIDSLRGRVAGGGRRGGGGGAKGTGTPSTAIGKVISSEYTLDSIMPLLTINPQAPKKDRKAAEAYFALNYASLENARQRGDAVWLFYDPRRPESLVQARDPQGNPITDKNGKPVMVRGSAYLPVTDEAFANLNYLRADYFTGLAEIALADHDIKSFASYYRRAIEAEDKGRRVSAEGVQRSARRFIEAGLDGIDEALASQDYATALNLARDIGALIADSLANPMLDEARRAWFERQADRLAKNPLLPKVDPATGIQTGGAIDLARSTTDAEGNFVSVELRPGWHFVLDRTNEFGQPNWGLVYDDVQDGSWEQNHVTVQVKRGERVVTGEARLRTADVAPVLFVNVPGDGRMIIPAPAAAQMIALPDEYGNIVRAYSLDGRTWVRPLDGAPPALELTVDGAQIVETGGGRELVDAQGNAIFRSADGINWAPVAEYFAQNPNAVAWYGQREYEARRQRAQRQYEAEVVRLRRFAGEEGFTAAYEEQRLGRLRTARALDLASVEIGGPGQRAQLTYAGVNGINLLPPSIPTMRTAADRRGEVDAIAPALLGPRNAARAARARQHLEIMARRTGGFEDDPLATRLLDALGDAVGIGKLFAPLVPYLRPTLARAQTELARRQLPPDTPDRFEGVPLHVQTGKATGDIGYRATSPLPPLPTPSYTQIGKETGDISYKPTAALPPLPKPTSTVPPAIQLGKETGDISYKPTSTRRRTTTTTTSRPGTSPTAAKMV